MARRGAWVRLGGLLAVGVVLAAAGCSGKSAAVTASAKRVVQREASASASISASDAALLRAAESTRDPSMAIMRQVGQRVEQLAKELTAAPFVAETTLTLPGVRPSGAVRLPTAPKVEPRRSDRFEPDSRSNRASVLHMGSTQTRTLSSSKDVDWIALPNDEGRGYFYISASRGDLLVESRLLRRGDEADDAPYAFGPRDGDFFGVTPAGDYDRLGRYSWIKITSDKPVSYRISHLKSLPQSLVGDYEPGQIMLGFEDPLREPDPTDWFMMTGLRASPTQLRKFRESFVCGEDNAIMAGGFWSPSDAPLQRCIGFADVTGNPTSFWLRTEKRGKNWVLTAAGRDASWKSGEYADKFRAYQSLRAWLDAHTMCAKPAIYLYPSREQSVTVHVDYRGVLTSTSPVIDSATKSWTVRAKPDGALTDASGRRWPYLFWEGMGAPEWDLATGRVIRGADADAYLRRVLAERGLNATESREFREFWVPILSASPWVLVHWEGATYERYAPLSVTPKPDTSLRVFMVAKPLDAPIAVTPQRLPPPPKRRGFTLVEWGGALAP